jgi:hypothetical protein
MSQRGAVSVLKSRADGFFVVKVMRKSADGFWIADADQRTLDVEELSSVMLGRIVLAALENSMDLGASPILAADKSRLKRYYESLACRNESGLNKKYESASVYTHNEKIILVPYKSQGSRGAVPDRSREIIAERTVSEEQLGQHLLDLLQPVS